MRGAWLLWPADWAMAASADDACAAGVARGVLGIPKQKPEKEEGGALRSFFGAPIHAIAAMWSLLLPHLGMAGSEPKHLLWALAFLKAHPAAAARRRIAGWPGPEARRKWCWHFLEKVALLEGGVAQLGSRLGGHGGPAPCLMPAGGVDCMANEPWPFGKKWHSQKLSGPGIKHEAGACAKAGRTCWAHGPLAASASGSTAFKQALAGLLAGGEGVEAGAGYQGHFKLKAPSAAAARAGRKQKSQVRGRHENANGRLKAFNVLSIPLRRSNP